MGEDGTCRTEVLEFEGREWDLVVLGGLTGTRYMGWSI